MKSTVLVLVFCASLAGLLVYGNPLKRSAYAPTVESLTNAYQSYNESYFYGGLPADKTSIRLEDVSPNMGQTVQAEGGRWIIRIDVDSNPITKQAELTLLHEMCHQRDAINGYNEGLDKHQGAFQACMKDLAARDAFKDLW